VSTGDETPGPRNGKLSSRELETDMGPEILPRIEWPVEDRACAAVELDLKIPMAGTLQ
jgi:hypothetical protein